MYRSDNIYNMAMANNTKSIGHNIISLLLFANTMVRDSRVTLALVELLRKQQYNKCFTVIHVEPPIYGTVCQCF